MFAWHAFSRIRRLRRLKGRLYGWLRLVSALLNNYYSVCVTLTYAPDQRWCGRDVSAFIKRVRDYYRYRGWRLVYFWVAELQERGAVHYHVILFVPKGHILPKPDQQGWWRKGFTNIMSVRSFASYLAKYLQKVESDGKGIWFPKGLRIYGYGGMDYFERGMYRVGWLHPDLRGRLLALFDVFLVAKKRGSKLELDVGGRRFMVIVLSPFLLSYFPLAP